MEQCLIESHKRTELLLTLYYSHGGPAGAVAWFARGISMKLDQADNPAAVAVGS
ncbi:hypothetical protein FHR92_003326 [Fontibacillus solani]|uniref:Uncharacterized protein n=1 Tax=Fontibacillus solani TaxID=1572857 RepID=A0A7W3SV67_9BACL|nr:hypothetical protein [Fontibacillus solani]